MIVLTRLNGVGFAVNPDLIERAEATPDTVLVLVDGTRYVVRESLADLLDLVTTFRARVLASAQLMTTHGSETRIGAGQAAGGGRVIPLHLREV